MISRVLLLFLVALTIRRGWATPTYTALSDFGLNVKLETLPGVQHEATSDTQRLFGEFVQRALDV